MTAWPDLDAWANLAVIAQTGLIAAGTWYVSRQVHEARQLQEDTARPYVVVDLENRGQRLDLVIRNIGQTPAIDVRVEFDPPPLDVEERITAVVPMLRDEGLSFLAPGRELRFFYGVTSHLFQASKQLTFTVTVSYSAAARASRPSPPSLIDPPYLVDLQRLSNVSATTPAEDKIEQHLEKIAGSIAHLTKQVGGIGQIYAEKGENPGHR